MMPVIVTAIVLFAILLSAAGRYVTRKIIRAGVLEEAHETISIFFGAVGLIYSLILAFALVGVWDDYEELHSTIRKESMKLQSAGLHASVADTPIAQEVSEGLRTYRRLISQEEWHAVKSDRKASHELLHSLQQSVNRYAGIAAGPATNRAVALTLADDLEDLDDLRQDRLAHATAHMPPIVWLLLTAGSILVIVMSWLFTSAERRLHIFLTSSLCMLVLLCLLVLYRLDHPLLAYKEALLHEYGTVLIQ